MRERKGVGDVVEIMEDKSKKGSVDGAGRRWMR